MAVAFVLLNVDLGKEDEVLNKIRSMDGVKEAYRVYGVYDTVVKVEAGTTEELKKIISWRIRRMPNVRSTLTMIAIE